MKFKTCNRTFLSVNINFPCNKTEFENQIDTIKTDKMIDISNNQITQLMIITIVNSFVLRENVK